MKRIIVFAYVILWCGFFSGAQELKLMLPVGHTNTVNSAAFSPDGKKIVTASLDLTVKIWDANSGLLLADLKGHSNIVNSAQFSSDGKKIVTSSWDKTARIWDADKGISLAELKGHTSIISMAEFSADGKKIVTASWDNTAKIWDGNTGRLLADLKGHKDRVNAASFSPDGKKIVTASFDSTARIWDASTGRLLAQLKGHTDRVNTAQFSPDGKRVITASDDKTARIWDVNSGRLIAELKGHSKRLNTAQFSDDSKKIVTASDDNTAKMWDAKSGALLADLEGHNLRVLSAHFSHKAKKILTNSADSTAKIWDANSGLLLTDVKNQTGSFTSAQFSPDGKKIVTASYDRTAKIWDVSTGMMLVNLNGHTERVNAAQFGHGGARIITASYDSTLRIWNANTGTLLTNFKKYNAGFISVQFQAGKIVTSTYDSTAKILDAYTGTKLLDLIGHNGVVITAQFSPDGKKVVTASWDKTAKIWNANTGALLVDLKGHADRVNSAQFSTDGKKIVTASDDNTAKIWDAVTGKLLLDLKNPGGGIMAAQFSPDGEKIVTASDDKTAKIWDVNTGTLLVDLKGHSDRINAAQFSPDGKKIVTASDDNTARIWDVNSGRLIAELRGHSSWVYSAQFNSEGTRILTISQDNTSKMWDANKGSILYTFFVVDSSDYLVVDKENHYDGTPGARKLLYYTCGTEVIELQQLKDKLWVPGLVERINNGETINAPELSDLDICNLIPTVNQIENKAGYQFKITAQKGVLGKTSLFVNGIETRTYNPLALKKVSGGYELLVEKNELKKFFIAGKANIVSVKAYSKENISSKGMTVLEAAESKNTLPPNLYAVVIGVSKYKGDDLDLQYAAKDAGDLSNAVSLSAGKMLGRDHVFMYDLTTDKQHYLLPDKKNIESVFAEIGKKATANDILLIFFAGHGVVEGAKKQFYFLTAEASASSITPMGLKDVGISTEELTEWIKPQNIQAQKRILILDACQSGMAIDKILSIGGNQGYLAQRNDDKAEQIKQIDKLNEAAGLIVLSSTASDQSAYEIGRYSQGLLTYSLLKAIKRPDVLEDGKYLNVGRWFDAALKIFTPIVRETASREEPLLISSTNFNIGVVDRDVLAGIVLSDEKVLFGSSSFQNTDSTVAYDDLLIGSIVDSQLNEASSRRSGAPVTYISTTNSPDAYIISGRYSVKEDEIKVKVNLRQSREPLPKYSFDVTGNKNDVKTLVENIVQRSLEWIEKTK